MPSNDIRITGWDLPASAGMTYEMVFTSSVALTSLALYVGGTLDDVDNLTGATAYNAVLSGANLVATVNLDVPTGEGTPLRLVVDGAVITTGYLRPSTGGTKTLASSAIPLNPGSISISLAVPSIVGGGGGGAGTDDQVAAEVPFTPSGGLAATDVQAALVELDTEKSDTGHNHAGDYDPAGTASSAVATHEADTLGVHGITDTAALETQTGAQAKADAAQAAAVQRANHTGTQLSATISDLTEVIQDAVGAMATDGATVNFTYDDIAGTFTAEVQGLTSANVSDFTEAVDDRVAALLVAGTNVTLTYNDVAGTLTVAATTDNTAVNDHIADTVDAHDASAVSIADAGLHYTATDVEGALQEVPTLITNATSSAVNDGDAAGGVLTGTYPNPGFASDMATQAELDAVAAAKENTLNAAGVVAKFTGTPDGTKFLRDDGTLVTPPGGAAAGATVVVKSVDETISNSITVQNDDELLFAVGANESWQFQVILQVSGHPTYDFRTALTFPAGATLRASVVGPVVGAAGGGLDDMDHCGTIAASGDEVAAIGADPAAQATLINGGIINGATAGTVRVQWAQNTAGAADLTVKAGSTLIAHKVA